MTWKPIRFVRFLAPLIAAVLFLPGCSNPSQEATLHVLSSNGVEPYEIVMAYMGAQGRDLQQVQDAMSRITLEKINATVKLVPIDVQDYSRQISLMLMGKDKLDLFMTYSIDTNILKRQIIPLDSLLELYGQDIRLTLGTDILNAVRFNGHIYGLPSMRDYAWSYGIVMRRDVLDRNGLTPDNLHSLDDLEQVLEKVKENEPQLTPLVPLASRWMGESMYYGINRGTFDSLGDTPGVLPGYDHDLKLVNLYESKTYANDLNRLRKWYLSGYLLKDPVRVWESGSELVRENKAFAYFTPMKPEIEVQESMMTGTPMTAVPLSTPVMTTDNLKLAMMSIAHKSEKPEKAMLLLNLLYSDKTLLNLLDNGLEGKHYIKLDDGRIDIPPGMLASDKKYRLVNWSIGNQFITHVWAPNHADIWDKIQSFNHDAKKSKAFGFTFNAEPVKAELAMVNGIRDQYLLGLETGVFDPAIKLPEFIVRLREAGIDRIIAEKQRQLDEWVKLQY